MDVKTAVRTLDIFETFAREQRPLVLSELGSILAIPLSSCLALIKTYQSAGYLYEVHRRGGYYPTRRIVDVAERIAEQDPVLQRLAPALRELRETSGETVVVGKVQSRKVIYLQVFESKQTIRYSASAGDFRSLHANSLGKALLGAMTDGARDAMLKGYKFDRFTEFTITSRKAFEKDLAAARRRGWYTNVGESLTDIAGVACPIDIQGEGYAISIAGPYYRVEPRLSRHAGLLVKTRDAIVSARGTSMR
jgi:DNA-binding IclR family transcriptional regulator